MVRKKEKEIIHQPDILIKTFGNVSAYVRSNTRQCIYGLIAFVVIIAAIASYLAYAGYQDQKMQYELAKGIESFEAYDRTRVAGDIEKAEGIFQKIAAGASGNTRYIAQMYLAKINISRGKTEEALKLYQEVSRSSSNQVLTRFASTAIKSLEKK